MKVKVMNISSRICLSAYSFELNNLNAICVGAVSFKSITLNPINNLFLIINGNSWK